MSQSRLLQPLRRRIDSDTSRNQCLNEAPKGLGENGDG